MSLCYLKFESVWRKIAKRLTPFNFLTFELFFILAYYAHNTNYFGLNDRGTYIYKY